jgi:hypothetical protein
MKVVLPKLPEYPRGVILEFEVVPCGWREFVTNAREQERLGEMQMHVQ